MHETEVLFAKLPFELAGRYVDFAQTVLWVAAGGLAAAVVGLCVLVALAARAARDGRRVPWARVGALALLVAVTAMGQSTLLVLALGVIQERWQPLLTPTAAALLSLGPTGGTLLVVSVLWRRWSPGSQCDTS